MSGLGDSWLQFFALPETFGVPPYLIFLSCKGQKIFCLLKEALEKINALKVVRCVIISNS